MELKLGKIKLFSKDIKKLAAFLAFVFDESPQVINDQEIEIHFLGLNFLLVESKTDALLQNSQLCFECEDLELLEVYMQKLQFYQYKSDTTFEAPIMSESTLLFTDTDKRQWEFYVSLTTHKPMSAESTSFLTSHTQM